MDDEVVEPCPWCGGELYDRVAFQKAHGAGVCSICSQCVSVDHDCPCGRALKPMREANEQRERKPVLPAGWGFPARSTKAHFFQEGNMDSLCGRWGFFGGDREPDTASSTPSDCVQCTRKLTKLKAEAR